MDIIIITSTSEIHIKSTKELLINCDYFSSLFELGDPTDNKLSVNLTNFKYENIDEHVKILFEYINNLNDKNEFLQFDVNINKLIELTDFFGANFMVENIKKSIDEYHCNMDDVNTCDHEILESGKICSKKDEFTNFITNVWEFYEIFKKMEKMDEFKYIAKMINKSEIQSFITMDIVNIPLYQCYEISLLMPNKCTDVIYPLLKYYYNLTYTKLQNSEYDYQVYTCDDYTPKTNFGEKSMIAPNEFIDKFNFNTNNIFVHIDWSNIIIAGGFIFGLLNNISNGIIESTDIDIFIYSEYENVREQKWKYLLKYFERFSPCYKYENGTITIIIPTLKYNIQIIVMLAKEPNEVIQEFDLNYVKLYYNGKTVNAHIECMFGFKYQLATCNLIFTNNLDKRLCKTIMKGLQLIKNNDIDIHSKLIKNNKIVNISMHKKNICEMYNLRQHFNGIEWKENVNYFDSDTIITTNYEHLCWKNVCNAFVSYKGTNLSQNVLLDTISANNCRNIRKIQKDDKIVVYAHIMNDRIENIYIDIKYDVVSFYESGSGNYAFKCGCLVMIPNIETINLIKSYGKSMGLDPQTFSNCHVNDYIDDTKDMSMERSLSRKIRQIIIKLHDGNLVEQKYADIIKDHCKMKNIRSGEKFNDGFISVICNMTWIKTRKRLIGMSENYHCKFNLSKITFNSH